MVHTSSNASQQKVTVVGGGLAGCEASYQLLRKGFAVDLYEMRPEKHSAAHKTDHLAELVCSNSLKSMGEDSAPGLLKHDLALLDSLIIKAAHEAKVPAGQALAVDRLKFSAAIEKALESFDGFRRIAGEVTELPTPEELEASGEQWLLATGPLTSEPLAKSLMQYCGTGTQLFFYDAIAPILQADSLDFTKVYRGNRYGEPGVGDYINVPFDEAEYREFIADVKAGEKSPLHGFETTSYFESCLPIEVMVERGEDTLRFGPMKPVGLIDPATGKRPYAALQLRIENDQESMYSMVGFQTKLKWPEQKRIFSKFRGFQNVEFFRYGSVHRNTYVEGPKVLSPDMSLRQHPNVTLAGQITGVEGYVESTAIGLLAGRCIAAKLSGQTFAGPPPTTMLGALYHYVQKGIREGYQPMNTNFGILQKTEETLKIRSKKNRKLHAAEQARKLFASYAENIRSAGL